MSEIHRAEIGPICRVVQPTGAGSPLTVGKTAKQAVVNPQVGALLPVPGEPLLNQLPSPAPHLHPPGGIVEQAVDQAGKLGDIPGWGVNRRPLR